MIISTDKKRTGLELLRFLQLEISMYFYSFATFSADKAHKSLTFRRKIKKFQQVIPVCHDFCQVPFRFFSFFFSGVVVFIALHSIHTTTHICSSKRVSVHPFIPLHFIHSFSPPPLLYPKKNSTPRKNRAKPVACGNNSEECVQFYNFVNLSADSYQVCLKFSRILQRKVFCYFDNSHKINTFAVGCTLTVCVYEKWLQIIEKTTACNRQFGASGGVVSWDTSQDF